MPIIPSTRLTSLAVVGRCGALLLSLLCLSCGRGASLAEFKPLRIVAHRHDRAPRFDYDAFYAFHPSPGITLESFADTYGAPDGYEYVAPAGYEAGLEDAGLHTPCVLDSSVELTINGVKVAPTSLGSEGWVQQCGGGDGYLDSACGGYEWGCLRRPTWPIDAFTGGTDVDLDVFISDSSLVMRMVVPNYFAPRTIEVVEPSGTTWDAGSPLQLQVSPQTDALAKFDVAYACPARLNGLPSADLVAAGCDLGGGFEGLDVAGNAFLHSVASLSDGGYIYGQAPGGTVYGQVPGGVRLTDGELVVRGIFRPQVYSCGGVLDCDATIDVARSVASPITLNP